MSQSFAAFVTGGTPLWPAFDSQSGYVRNVFSTNQTGLIVEDWKMQQCDFWKAISTQRSISML
jgi:hypothetical protein